MLFHREPRILEMSELCSSGLEFRIFRLSSFAQIMNAFIGLLMWFFCRFWVFSRFGESWSWSVLGPGVVWPRPDSSWLAPLRFSGSWGGGTVWVRTVRIFLCCSRKRWNLRMTSIMLWCPGWVAVMSSIRRSVRGVVCPGSCCQLTALVPPHTRAGSTSTTRGTLSVCLSSL